MKFLVLFNHIMVIGSLPARGVWIEMQVGGSTFAYEECHSPQGECGLKSVVLVLFDTTAGHSPQGECGLKYEPSAGALAGPCRSPHGERGLKFGRRSRLRPMCRRSPHGERGLKSHASPGGLRAHRVALLTESVD